MTGYVFDFEGRQYDPNGRAQVDNTAEHNAEISRAELAWFINEKPARHFAYVNFNKHGMSDAYGYVTTWHGQILGYITWLGKEYKVPAYGWPSTRQNLRIHAVNGLVYSAVYYKSSGDYCRMKVVSTSKRKAVR